MLTLNTLRRRLLLAGSCALLGILTACGGTADVNEIAPTPAPPAQTAPAFNTQPASVTVTAPAAASFSVAVSGNPTPTLQWQVSIDAGVNWVNVPAATAATLTINPTIVGQNNNRYRAVATNSVGSVNSSAATLTVNAPGVNVPWQADQLIAGGGTQTLVVRANGELWSWGTNNAGALGRADGNTVTAPGAVTTFGNNVRSVAAGAWYSVALRNDGSVWAWGDGGIVGDAVVSSGAIRLPLRVQVLADVRAISTRYLHTLALRNDGTVWGFGPENFSALGPTIGSRVARQITGLSNVRQVAAGEQHSMALLADGTVRTWGSNTLSQLGVSTGGAPRTAPQTVALTDVVAIAASSFASFALRSDGTLWRWGSFVGRENLTPEQISVAFSGSISALAAGNQTLHVLRNDGTVFGMGENSFGRVGIGTTGGTVTTLSQIGLIGGAVIGIGGGEFHALAIRNDGRVFAWGGNGQRQLSGVVGGDANAPLDTGFSR